MMEFILWVIFIKMLSQVIIIEKDCDNWKRSWLLKKIEIIEKDCDNWKKINAYDKINLVVI